jgi:hypothetical protein
MGVREKIGWWNLFWRVLRFLSIQSVESGRASTFEEIQPQMNSDARRWKKGWEYGEGVCEHFS